MSDVIVVESTDVHVIEAAGGDVAVVESTDVQVIEVGIVGPQGPAGGVGAPGPPGANGGAWLFEQSVPATTWTITHPLDYRPNVTTVDSLDREVEGDVTYVSATQITVQFSSPVSGKAYLS